MVATDLFSLIRQENQSLSVVTWEQGLTTWVWWVFFSAFLAPWTAGELLSDVTNLSEPVGRVLLSKPPGKPTEYSLLGDGTGAFSHSSLNENLTGRAGGKSAAWEGVLRQQRGGGALGSLVARCHGRWAASQHHLMPLPWWCRYRSVALPVPSVLPSAGLGLGPVLESLFRSDVVWLFP